MTGSPAEQAAEDIAPALVAGHNAVANHKGGAADVVGDYPQGDVLFLVIAVVHIGNAADVLHNVLHRVHQEQVVHVLHNAGQTLQAHAGVDVGVLHRRIVALAVAVKLAEHHVPEFYIAVALTAGAAVRGAAAVLGAAVKVDFGAGAAGAGAVLPEVILLAEADHMVFRDTDLFGPDVVGFIVIQVDRNIEFFSRDLQVLRQKFPGPGDDLLLEIILETEIAQHLKESAVPRRDTDALDVRRADALLAGGDTVAWRLLLTEKPLFHRRHTTVDQQQAGIIFRHQREAAQTQMVFGLKKMQVLLT